MPQLIWDDQEFATVPLVKNRCEDIGILTQKNGEQLDSLIAKCIGQDATDYDNAKYDLKKHLYSWAKDKYPDTIEKWQSLVGYAFGRYRDRFDLDKLRPNGGAWYYNNNEFIEISGVIPAALNPQTYYTNTVPVNGTSGTLAGVAANGARLDYIATTGEQRLYINRGSITSPTWEKTNHRDAVNWILNSEVLIEPHICATMRRLAEKGIFSNRVNYQDRANKEFSMDSESYWNIKFLDTLYGQKDEKGRTINPGILKDLDIDYSGDGIMSDFEMATVGEEHFGFA